MQDMYFYMDRFNPDSDSDTLESHFVSDVTRLIERKNRGGIDLIEYLCSMLTNDGVNRNRGRTFITSFKKWAKDDNKYHGISILSVLYLNVYGMKMKRELDEEGGEEEEEEEEEEDDDDDDGEGEDVEGRDDDDGDDSSNSASADNSDSSSTVRRMREVWKDEGKDEEGRRELERRWREVGDIMNEEDVMEVFIMHLCIPNTKGVTFGTVVPSRCSVHSLRVLLNEKVDTNNPHHFPIYDLTHTPINVLIIRNLPLKFDRVMVIELIKAIDSIAEVASAEQELLLRYNLDEFGETESTFAVIRVLLFSDEYAPQVVRRLDGSEFYGKYLSVKQGLYIPRPLPPSIDNKIKRKRSSRR